MDSIFLTVNDKLSPNDRHVCSFRSSTDPKLISCLCRSIQGKSPRRVIIDSFCLEIFSVTAMTNLGQAKASDVFGCEPFSYEILMGLESPSAEGNEGFGV